MTASGTDKFCFDFRQTETGEIKFQCSRDKMKWPWLHLPPAHNAAIQYTNYYATMGVSAFTNTVSDSAWSALTEFEYQVGEGGVGDLARHPVRGVARQEQDTFGFDCDFFDEDDRLVYCVKGKGVVFRNRDFKAWRAPAKAEVLKLPLAENFDRARVDAVGARLPIEVLVEPIQEDGERVVPIGTFVQALVTKAEGFQPVHPYHDGSGDHVNSAHLFDSAQQMAFMTVGPQLPVGGGAKFMRYVELDRPFRIELTQRNGARIDFSIKQADKPCVQLYFIYQD